eukprot:31175-Pelagococcus_subviridis.AAC.7
MTTPRRLGRRSASASTASSRISGSSYRSPVPFATGFRLEGNGRLTDRSNAGRTPDRRSDEWSDAPRRGPAARPLASSFPCSRTCHSTRRARPPRRRAGAKVDRRDDRPRARRARHVPARSVPRPPPRPSKRSDADIETLTRRPSRSR